MEQDYRLDFDFAPNWDNEADRTRLLALCRNVGKRFKESVKSCSKITRHL